MVPGETWTQSCTGTNTSVGGTTVDAFHFVQPRTISGAQHGEENSELWFAPNGLPLRNQRHIVIDSDSPIGTIT
jgi:hypothetical protein